MSADGVQLTIDMVRRHAGSVDAVAGAVQQARAAVGVIGMDTQAYGVLCQFMPAMLVPLFDIAVGALSAHEDALRATADDLRATAAAAQRTDEASGRRVTAAGRSSIELPL